MCFFFCWSNHKFRKGYKCCLYGYRWCQRLFNLACVCAPAIVWRLPLPAELEKKHTHTVSLVLRQTQCRLNSNVIYWQLCPSPIFLFLPTPRLSLALHRHRPFPFIPHFRCSEQTFDGVRLLSMKVQFEVPFFFLSSSSSYSILCLQCLDFR